ncbi:hypothetical protein XENORESO_013521 [Xenotaenia resolanae]|uniref:Uncharacterized protein n=1 Tax=Xenotaenia resolanae TaxID=208358 RepID=A0ABV0WFX0_9TELE
MSASMPGKTFSLQCYHFSSNPSASCLLGRPILPSSLLLLSSLTRLTLCHSMFPLRNPEFYSDASLCPDTVAEDGIHHTSHSRKSIDNRFLFLLPIVVLLIFLPDPSLFAFCFFSFIPTL